MPFSPLSFPHIFDSKGNTKNTCFQYYYVNKLSFCAGTAHIKTHGSKVGQPFIEWGHTAEEPETTKEGNHT